MAATSPAPDLWALAGVASRWFCKHGMKDPIENSIRVGVQILLLRAGVCDAVEFEYPKHHGDPPDYTPHGVSHTAALHAGRRLVRYGKPQTDAETVFRISVKAKGQGFQHAVCWMAVCSCLELRLWSEPLTGKDLIEIVATRQKLSNVLKPFGLKVQVRIG